MLYILLKQSLKASNTTNYIIEQWLVQLYLGKAVKIDYFCIRKQYLSTVLIFLLYK